jgi:hypothetical protein
MNCVVKFHVPNSKFPSELKIYDISGRLVKSFSVPNSYFLVPSEVTWDGRDDQNRPFPTGIYFVHLTHDGLTDVQKIILIQ